jgi:hypothetical protein
MRDVVDGLMADIAPIQMIEDCQSLVQTQPFIEKSHQIFEAAIAHNSSEPFRYFGTYLFNRRGNLPRNVLMLGCRSNWKCRLLGITDVGLILKQAFELPFFERIGPSDLMPQRILQHPNVVARLPLRRDLPHYQIASVHNHSRGLA